MRRHRAFAALQLWRDAPSLNELVKPEHLAVVRLEPIRRHGHAEAVLDLTFAHDGEIVVVPGAITPTRMVALRESDPLVWPAAIADRIDDGAADGVRDRLLPWLNETFAGRELTGERIAVLDPAFDERWRVARELRFAGAAPLEEAWLELAPYLYARRFARNRRVVVAAKSAAQAPAALARVASEVHVPGLDPRSAEAAASWFGRAVETADDPGAEVLIADDAQHGALAARSAAWRIWLGGNGPGEPLRIARPVPFEVAFAYSDVRGEAALACTVESAQPAVPSPPVLPARRNSSGRILILLREGAGRAPDSDTDEGRALRARLEAEGIEAVVAFGPVAVAGFDLVHAVGLHEPGAVRELFAAARAASIPTVLTAQLEDLAQDGHWGAQVCEACFTLRPDEASIEMFLELLAGRRLAGATASPGEALPAEYLDGVRGALAMADAVSVTCPGEERLVKERFGYAGRVVHLPPLLPADPPAAANWLAGNESYALLLAPFEARTNALVALRAAGEAGIPLVVAGAVCDPAYAALLHEFAGEHGVIVEDPSPGIEAGLLARARVFVDCGWISRGMGRIVRAAMAGAEVVASSRGWGPELFAPALAAVDPGTVGGITEALRTAWNRDPAASSLAARAVVWADQSAVFERVLALYASLATGGS